MPVDMPWIRTYDFPGEYTKGYGLGLEGAKAQASLQQQANEMAQRAAMQQEQLAARQAEIELETKTRKEIAEKNLMAEQARADITAAYRQAQIGIQKQRLDESARLMDFKIKQAARQVGAEDRIRERIAAGEDKYKVLMEEGAPAGLGSAMGAIARASQATIPEDLVTEERGGRTYIRRRGSWYPGGAEAGVGKLDAMAIKDIYDSINREEDFIKKYAQTEEEKQAARDKIVEYKKQLNEAYKAQGAAPPHPGVALDMTAAKQIGKFKVRRLD